MISLDKAREILARQSVKTGEESVLLSKALHRILAQDVVSKINMPPFDKSAMDGFAVDSGDDSDSFRIMEIIPAGSIPGKRLGKGQCSKIMTGAMLPPGADRVIKREIARDEKGYMTIVGEDSEFNVCLKGEDVKIGDRLLISGKRLNPGDIGIIASMGTDKIRVFRRPSVGLVTTGAEIVEPGNQITEGQIYNSNACSLTAQLQDMSLDVVYSGIVEDRPEAIEAALSRMSGQVDLLLISGGVSMGDFDFVPRILEKIGFELYFEKVGIKPGKPTVFGRREERFVFGLPGNPVSTFIIFEVMVKPFLYRMMGHAHQPRRVMGTLKRDFVRRKASRHELVPAYIEGGEMTLIEYHGSAHIHALSRANALLEIPVGVKQIKKGKEVYVRPL